MNKQDKLFESIKKASKKQEQKNFAQKEKVWETISQKLNPKKQKRMIFYKSLSAAAVIAVLIFAGFQFTDSTDSLKENSLINKNVKIKNSQDTELVQDEIKPDKIENLDLKHQHSLQKKTTTPKQSKTKSVVSAKTDTEAIDNIAEREEHISNSSNAGYQNSISSSTKAFAPEKETNAIKISAIVRDSNVMAREQIVANDQKQSSQSHLQQQALKTQQNFITKIESQYQWVISGTVVDKDGFPIPGVNVIIKGTSNGTQTNFDGKFEIEVEKNQTLVFSYIGYNTQEIKIKTQKFLNIKLEPSMEALEEVVVVKTTKRKINPPPPSPEKIEIVEAENTVDVKSGYVSKQLQGRETGISINSAAGKTGSNPYIRDKDNYTANTQQPLYIIDGKTATIDDLKSLNPKKVKSVNIIKNKAELFMRGFGKKAKNGVIEISTTNEINSDIKPDSIVYWYKQHIGHYNNEDYEIFKENPFTSPLSEPLSTFSIDVDRAAYTNIRRMINNGQDVPKDAVRIEEMLNFFEYNYDKPTDKHPFAIYTAYSDAPWNTNHKLLKIALQGKDISQKNLPATNLVFLIDVSGSMNSQNKLPLVKKSLKLLTAQMRDKDKIAIVTYAGNSKIVLEPTTGKDKTKIKNAIDKLSSGGGTYASQGIETAYSLAEENFVKDGNNRVIIATDGDFNIGVTKNKSLEDLIANKRKTNIFLTCLGYGMGNYKDSKMQSLSQKGNGNYAYIDTYQEAQKFLEREFKGSLYAIAKDVKIQIEFNPKHVQTYRLIGYETRMLQDRDFDDDTKDAGEIGVNHQVTALYEVVPRGVKSSFGEFKPELKYQKVETPSFENYSDELATVKFRYKLPKSDKSIKIEKVIKNEYLKLDKTNGDFKFATAVAWFGLKLRNSKLITHAEKSEIINLAKQGIENDKEGYRAELIRLVKLSE